MPIYPRLAGQQEDYLRKALGDYQTVPARTRSWAAWPNRYRRRTSPISPAISPANPKDW
ncbi:MAG: hypothetical protein R3F40_03325 [Candidatus Competibacteraceae bacterium]